MRHSLVVLLLAFASHGCGGSEEPPAAGKPAASGSAVPEKGGKAPRGKKGVVEGAGASEKDPAPPKVEFQETDFAESDRSRDPFRSFTAVFMEQAKSKVRAQVNVVAKNYSIDDLRLVGIVSRIHPPRAMFIDPSGKGHVVDHGDFIGRPEIVQGGTTTTDYEIHWRVDRVRESDVVLVREDPANPDVPSATRVFPIRTTEGEIELPEE